MENDDGNDSGWFREEEKKMSNQYGGDFIRVRYNEQSGRVQYCCELCYANMNSKGNLEMHCSGMKHLKKKNLWEKTKQNDTNDLKYEEAIQGNNLRVQNDLRGTDRESRGPGCEFRGHVDDFRGREEIHYGYGQDQFGRIYDGIEGHGQSSHHRRVNDYSHNNSYTKDRTHDVYGRVEDNSLPRNRDGNNQFRGPPDDTPPHPRTPSIPVAVTPKENTLLQKLADCCIKNEDDVDLAINVVTSLVTSLKEYTIYKGDINVATVLTEAELKIKTSRALIASLKMFQDMTKADH